MGDRDLETGELVGSKKHAGFEEIGDLRGGRRFCLKTHHIWNAQIYNIETKSPCIINLQVRQGINRTILHFW